MNLYLIGWWLSHPSETYENQLGWLLPMYGKKPNHQPDRLSKQTLNIYWCLIYFLFICLYFKIIVSWLYALGVDHSKQIWFQTSELIMDAKHSDWWITEVEKPASELHLYSLYIYTYWFRFHLSCSKASAHINKNVFLYFVAGCDWSPGDWLDVALPIPLRALHLDQGHHT